VDNFTTAYVECALWSSTDDEGNPMDDRFDVIDIAPEALATMAADCADFRLDCGPLLDTVSDAQAGHDFWLTRNGHGAGFWDRGLGELGDKLTAAAKAYGSCDMCVGDDGKVYVA